MQIFFRFLGYSSENHGVDVSLEQHASSALKSIGTVGFVCSSIRLFISDDDLEVELFIYRNPLAWIECQIVSVPFEAF